MKLIQIILSLSLTLFATSSSVRSWTKESGQTFPAEFVAMKGGAVTLKNETGKVIKIPVAQLSIADRYYLNEKQNIPVEDLEGGNIFTAEQKFKVNSSEIKKIKPIEINGDGIKIKLEGFTTPHALFLYQRGLKLKEIIQALERVHFSHLYRHPNQILHNSGKRKTLLYLKEGDDIYEELGEELIARYQKEGKRTPLQLNQLEVNWARLRGHARWELPKKYAEELNSSQNVQIQFSPKKSDSRDRYLDGFQNRSWLWEWPICKYLYLNLPHKKAHKTPELKEQVHLGYSLVYGLAFNNDMRLDGEHIYRIGGGLDNSKSYVSTVLGDRKDWAVKLSKQVKDGTIKADLSQLANVPKNEEPTTKQQYDNFISLLLGAGRFLESDLRHMIGTARLSEYIHTNKKAPSLADLPQIYGYSSIEEMNAAFKEFLLKGNIRMKP